ncbi:MAG: YkgJ family cysteine cluster protein [Candidatus Bathyarchaeota archaeon]|nr:YkgJ family cysteine cluster protein [Candidatus Bathyarchaeota archaeon]
MMKKKAEGTKHSLASGIPCVKHRCVKCCLKTRMPLSNLDLKRILQLGYRLEYFTVKTKEGCRPRNSSGRCVFLQEEGRGIYPHRPEGCRVYPLVYDESLMRVVIDSICPYGYEFEAEKNDVESLEDLIQKIVDLISIF